MRVHQHARRVRRLAARHVDADAIERRDLLAEQRAVGVAVAPRAAAGLELALVVAADARGRGLQRVALRRRDGRERRAQSRRATAPAPPSTPAPARRSARVYSSTAASPRARTSARMLGHARFDRARRSRADQCSSARELGLEVGAARVELAHARRSWRRHRGAAKASISGRIGSRLSLSAAWLTTSRDEISMICSTSTRWFALQRAAGGHQVDDRVGQPGQRRQLHRAVELDQVDVHALVGEVLARDAAVYLVATRMREPCLTAAA